MNLFNKLLKKRLDSSTSQKVVTPLELTIELNLEATLYDAIVFKVSRSVKGGSLGEVYKKVREESLLLAKEFEDFLKSPFGKYLKEDNNLYFYLSSVTPDVMSYTKFYNLKNDERAKERLFDDLNRSNGWGNTILSSENIIRSVNLHTNMEIDSLIRRTELYFRSDLKSMNPKIEYSKSYGETDLNKIIEYGYTPEEIDNIIEKVLEIKKQNRER